MWEVPVLELPEYEIPYHNVFNPDPKPKGYSRRRKYHKTDKTRLRPKLQIELPSYSWVLSVLRSRDGHPEMVVKLRTHEVTLLNVTRSGGPLSHLRRQLFNETSSFHPDSHNLWVYIIPKHREQKSSEAVNYDVLSEREDRLTSLKSAQYLTGDLHEWDDEQHLFVPSRPRQRRAIGPITFRDVRNKHATGFVIESKTF